MSYLHRSFISEGSKKLEAHPRSSYKSFFFFFFFFNRGKDDLRGGSTEDLRWSTQLSNVTSMFFSVRGIVSTDESPQLQRYNDRT